MKRFSKEGRKRVNFSKGEKEGVNFYIGEMEERITFCKRERKK